MKVSVIIPVFNGGDILDITIPAILNQDYSKKNTQIIIVDDGSTDNSKQKINKYLFTKQIQVVTHLENKGRSKTRNSGIKIARGELIIFLDCDIEVEVDFISKHVCYHKQKNVIGLLSNIKTRINKLNNKYHRYIFNGKRGAAIIGENKPLPFNYFIIGCTSVKSFAVSQVGGFNENYDVYGEDLDFAYRLWNIYSTGLYYTKNINVYIYKLKTLDEALSILHDYGQYNVPNLLLEFPDINSSD